MSEAELVLALNKFGLNINDIVLSQLKIYAEELIVYNEHTNLTSIKDIKQVYLKHFYDSLTLVNVIDFSNQMILDVGTGAGFPGLVLKIIFPNVNLTLLDSNNKKTSFLRYITDKLKIRDVNIINARAEDYVKKSRDKYDVVLSRAVAKLRILAEISLPFLKVGGLFVAMKANCSEELLESQSIINILNSQIDKVVELKLPMEESIRTLVVIKKNGSISEKYPREYNKILNIKL